MHGYHEESRTAIDLMSTHKNNTLKMKRTIRHVTGLGLSPGAIVTCIGLVFALSLGVGLLSNPSVMANPINIQSFINADQIDFFGNVLDHESGLIQVAIEMGQAVSVVNTLDDPTHNPFGIDFIGQPAEARAFTNDDGTFGGVVHTGLSPGGGAGHG